ncbi:virulence factor [Lutibaculum baratangense]|uniref:Virulence factor domain-containing protein n=1 Tax=Lutibaculum baratangense AMV1 TaxID=631454 RepID=V4TAN3_9HYPH|nr:virulence factor [Lutibaculum baratangense]ESR23493.1 hypothetical protein N177_3561 [Lutibaculum baratangense AMV1]
MVKLTLVSWQEIPSMIEARDGRDRARVELSARFQELIDMMAMRRGLAGTDAYLEAWRRQPLVEREGGCEDLARAAADEFEARYEDIRAAAIATPA